jgi:hypothetical protein
VLRAKIVDSYQGLTPGQKKREAREAIKKLMPGPTVLRIPEEIMDAIVERWVDAEGADTPEPLARFAERLMGCPVLHLAYTTRDDHEALARYSAHTARLEVDAEGRLPPSFQVVPEIGLILLCQIRCNGMPGGLMP